MEHRSTVALAHGENVQENVTRVFDLLGGVQNLIKPGETIVLKPNAGHASGPETAVNTSPEMVRAVIKEVRKANPKSIIIAESAAIGCDTVQCFEVSGIAKVAEEEGIELMDIKREKDLIRIPVRGYRSNINEVKLPRAIVEADHIINLPILKAHASMVFSGALKNIKGVVQDRVHNLMHQQNLTMAMMDVWYAVRADIQIMDVMYAASGYSPHTPVPFKVDCVLGSLDPVALDRIACELVEIDPECVDYFKVADEAGLGTTDPALIDVVGDDLEKCKKKMWIPYIGDITNRWPEWDIRCQGACSSCQAHLTLNMETLKAIGEYDKNSDMTIVCGRANEVGPEVQDEKLILSGNCAKRHLKDHPGAIWIYGCPPGEGAIYMSVIKKEAIDGSTEEQLKWIRPRMDQDHPAWQAYVDARAREVYGDSDDYVTGL